MTEAEFELAAKRAEQERNAGVRSAGVALSRIGTETCIDCGEDIPAERRRIARFAVRCVDCQTFHEAEKYHR